MYFVSCILVTISPRGETRSGNGLLLEDQNVDVGLVQPSGLPPLSVPYSDIEESLGGTKRVVVDTGKRVAKLGLPGRHGKNIHDGRFRPKRRRGDFSCGSHVQSYARNSIGVSLCEQCHRSHSEECWWAIGACMVCGSKDHRKHDFPQVFENTVARAEVGVAPARGRG
ncbi:hypothetical protein V6N13_124045 [Hibiscus sabdariffa]